MSGPSFPAWLAKIRGVTLPLAGATGLTAESHHRIVYSVVLTSASYSVYVCQMQQMEECGGIFQFKMG